MGKVTRTKIVVNKGFASVSEISILTTDGNLPEVGKVAPAFSLVDSMSANLANVNLKDFTGKNVVMYVVPSLDTPTCEKTTRELITRTSQKENTVLLIVSIDTPWAQRRFCGADNNNTKVKPLSTFRNNQGGDHNFGKDYGVVFSESHTLEGNPADMTGALARALFVIDPKGIVQHVELVSELTQGPNFDAAFKVLDNLKTDAGVSAVTNSAASGVASTAAATNANTSGAEVKSRIEVTAKTDRWAPAHQSASAATSGTESIAVSSTAQPRKNLGVNEYDMDGLPFEVSAEEFAARAKAAARATSASATVSSAGSSTTQAASASSGSGATQSNEIPLIASFGKNELPIDITLKPDELSLHLLKQLKTLRGQDSKSLGEAVSKERILNQFNARDGSSQTDLQKISSSAQTQLPGNSGQITQIRLSNQKSFQNSSSDSADQSRSKSDRRFYDLPM